MSLKYFIDFTVACFKSLYLYNHKKCHSLPRISEKVHITAKFYKTEFHKYFTGGVSVSGIPPIHLIQLIVLFS